MGGGGAGPEADSTDESDTDFRKILKRRKTQKSKRKMFMYDPKSSSNSECSFDAGSSMAVNFSLHDPDARKNDEFNSIKLPRIWESVNLLGGTPARLSELIGCSVKT